MKRTSNERDFWCEADRSGGPLACWPWKSATGVTPTYKLYVDGRVTRVSARKQAYYYFFGVRPRSVRPCPHNRLCVNPNHLADSASVCPLGHLKDGYTTYLARDGRLLCTVCVSERARKWWDRLSPEHRERVKAAMRRRYHDLPPEERDAAWQRRKAVLAARKGAYGS